MVDNRDMKKETYEESGFIGASPMEALMILGKRSDLDLSSIFEKDLNRPQKDTGPLGAW